ncbi:hypothetical protein BD311DRAFT_755178 [Dichomitus squalens]|uniref:Uncharacterized protein n=1 Tax=Dichomitus squalens TaxID=114155 RepID=A0A4V6MVZ8_9APHY|nr:hypothetical protein BD311DRAFT_755178 [Dichomitus squalens]
MGGRLSPTIYIEHCEHRWRHGRRSWGRDRKNGYGRITVGRHTGRHICNRCGWNSIYTSDTGLILSIDVKRPIVHIERPIVYIKRANRCMKRAILDAELSSKSLRKDGIRRQ